MDIQIGNIVELKSGKYTIIEQIDEGGNGIVWKAIADDSQLYAIKVLKEDKDKDKKKLDRFGKECEFCKNTNHIHIVKVFDYVAEKGNAYCVMPYYSKNLRAVINEENDTFVLLNYIIQLCEAIQFIHSKDITHRDLKPENILIDENNILVLTDFGIAHFNDSIKTKKREWLGNRRYAAPEQLATDEITTACDVYALGRIINELFTKQNPAGEAFLTIAEKNPLLLPLDGIVQKCRIQNPDLRPNIHAILMELYLLEGEIKDRIEVIKDILYPLENIGYSKDEEEEIVVQATHDIILAQHIFENLPNERLEELNFNYHCNVLYNADETIRNLLFQTFVLDYCFHKLVYESNSYINEQLYEPLNLDNVQHQILYDELNIILDSHKIPYVYRDITARIKKYFCSCCDYHCVELLENIKDLCNHESPVINAPILRIVYILRKYLAKEDLKEIILQEHININWELKPDNKVKELEIYLVPLDVEEIEILDFFTEQYDVIYAKADFKHYYVRFKTTDAFNKFRKNAIELSHSSFVFEGDVKKIIRVRRKYHDIVELEPLDSFDITNTLANILGLRNDY